MHSFSVLSGGNCRPLKYTRASLISLCHDARRLQKSRLRRGVGECKDSGRCSSGASLKSAGHRAAMIDRAHIVKSVYRFTVFEYMVWNVHNVLCNIFTI